MQQDHYSKKARLENLPAETISQIVSLRHNGLSFRKIAKAVNLSHGSVQRLLHAAREGKKPAREKSTIPAKPRRALPDFASIASAIAKGSTVRDCWQIYASSNTPAYTYERFCVLFNAWCETTALHATAASEREQASAVASRAKSRRSETRNEINGAAKARQNRAGNILKESAGNIIQDVTKRVTRREAGGLPSEESGLSNGVAHAIPRFGSDELDWSWNYWQNKISPISETLVLYGHGCTLNVERGELVAWNGAHLGNPGRVNRRFPKIGHKLTAIVFTGSSGSISFEALRWTAAQNIGVFVLDWYGNLASVSSASIFSPAAIALRRAQFAANRLKTARAILREKLASGARIGKLTQGDFERAIARAARAKTIDELIIIEAQAALSYWSAWAFPIKHRKLNWPASPAWNNFAGRASELSGGPRHATSPVNAILNCAYSVTAARCARTLLTRGFDPACAFLHADNDNRYSLAYDMIELLRANLDAAILPWVAHTVWRRADFPVTRDKGIVRLSPPLAAVVCQKAAAACPQGMLDAAAQFVEEEIRRV